MVDRAGEEAVFRRFCHDPIWIRGIYTGAAAGRILLGEFGLEITG